MDQNKKNPNHWKDYAGIAVCSITVLAFIAIGFIIMAAKTAGVEMSPPGDWMAAMLSLASTALGWLAGQKGNKEPEPTPPPPMERPSPTGELCDTCPYGPGPRG